jgi:hydroxyethylthiazole kinase-like uncharacterized protein yjeF
MAGAAVLAVRSGLRGGSGIVRVVSDPANRQILQSTVPGAVFTDWDDPTGMDEAIDWAHALAIGPGLGRGDSRFRMVSRALERRGQRPVVLDADGLSVWQGRSETLAELLTERDVITPHPGELSRLLNVDAETIVSDLPDYAREAAHMLGCTVVLKGAPTCVAAGEDPLLVSTVGGTALAAGGSGDVLTGLTGALLAAGLDAPAAAASALFMSGLAAELGGHPAGHAADEVPDRLQVVRAAIEDLPSGSRGPVLFVSADPGKPGGGLSP